MSFRQKNEKKHSWQRFCQTNTTLIISTGLPLDEVLDYKAFLFFVEDGYFFQPGPWSNPKAFSRSDFTPEQREQFLRLAEDLVEAGFEYEATAGLTQAELMDLARKFPGKSKSHWWYQPEEEHV